MSIWDFRYPFNLLMHKDVVIVNDLQHNKKNIMWYYIYTSPAWACTFTKIKLCSFTDLISQTFSDSAVILAIMSNHCTQDLPIVNKQGWSIFAKTTFSPHLLTWVTLSSNILSIIGIFRLPESYRTKGNILLYANFQHSQLSVIALIVIETHTLFQKCLWSQYTHSTCFIGTKITLLPLVILNPG